MLFRSFYKWSTHTLQSRQINTFQHSRNSICKTSTDAAHACYFLQSRQTQSFKYSPISKVTYFGQLRKLTIGGATGSNPNTVITNLDCFENLESAESVYIEKQMGLISYKGLAKVIAGLNDAEAWEVIGNAFNPTFEEVKAGKLEKEE